MFSEVFRTSDKPGNGLLVLRCFAGPEQLRYPMQKTQESLGTFSNKALYGVRNTSENYSSRRRISPDKGVQYISRELYSKVFRRNTAFQKLSKTTLFLLVLANLKMKRINYENFIDMPLMLENTRFVERSSPMKFMQTYIAHIKLLQFYVGIS